MDVCSVFGTSMQLLRCLKEVVAGRQGSTPTILGTPLPGECTVGELATSCICVRVLMDV